jgi:hypothetical protein
MSAEILDGKLLAQKLSEELKSEVAGLQSKTGRTVRMVNVMVGEDHGACAYANSQKRVAQWVGIDYELLMLPANISQNNLEKELDRLSLDGLVNAVMLHKPVPSGIDFQSAVNSYCCCQRCRRLECGEFGTAAFEWDNNLAVYSGGGYGTFAGNTKFFFAWQGSGYCWAQ